MNDDDIEDLKIVEEILDYGIDKYVVENSGTRRTVLIDRGEDITEELEPNDIIVNGPVQLCRDEAKKWLSVIFGDLSQIPD